MDGDRAKEDRVMYERKSKKQNESRRLRKQHVYR